MYQLEGGELGFCKFSLLLNHDYCHLWGLPSSGDMGLGSIAMQSEAITFLLVVVSSLRFLYLLFGVCQGNLCSAGI